MTNPFPPHPEGTKTNRYILVQGVITPEPDLVKWARWIEDSGRERMIALHEHNGVTVSTVFLGLDHNFMGEGPPILFETLASAAAKDGRRGYTRTYRYATENEAFFGHLKACQEAFADGWKENVFNETGSDREEPESDL